MSADLEVRALRSAAVVACKIGIGKTEPVILCHSRHFCVLLPEHSVVARIISATESNLASGIREMTIARHLSAKGAPALAPHESMPSQPCIEDGMLVTFWPYIPHEAADYDDQEKVADAARALDCIHKALIDYSGETPPYTSKIEECVMALRRPDILPILTVAERSFLISTYERLEEALVKHSLSLSPIHGDAHMGNVFFTPRGPLWTDFEAVCLGPREWDAATMLNHTAFPELNDDICNIMSKLHSLCMVVWCSFLAESPSKKAAAQYHLARLKSDNTWI